MTDKQTAERPVSKTPGGRGKVILRLGPASNTPDFRPRLVLDDTQGKT